jgi:large subunit ribosomal protein L1
VPSKKAAAAKARRKVAFAAADEARAEKLTLADAVSVLRVRTFHSLIMNLLNIPSQAVEVASPNNTYELFVKTEIKSGIAVPKGRVNLPREAKPRPEEKVLVFSEGRQAEEARKAGAHIVGGTELIDGVSCCVIRSHWHLVTYKGTRSSTDVYRQRLSSVHLLSLRPLRPNLVAF